MVSRPDPWVCLVDSALHVLGDMSKPKTSKKPSPPPPPTVEAETQQAVQEVRRKRIKEALILENNNRRRAAVRLGCAARTFYNWLAALGLLHWKLTDEPELVAQVIASQGVAK